MIPASGDDAKNWRYFAYSLSVHPPIRLVKENLYHIETIRFLLTIHQMPGILKLSLPGKYLWKYVGKVNITLCYQQDSYALNP